MLHIFGKLMQKVQTLERPRIVAKVKAGIKTEV